MSSSKIELICFISGFCLLILYIAVFPGILLFFIENDVACVSLESGSFIDVAQRFKLVLTLHFASILPMAFSFCVIGYLGEPYRPKNIVSIIAWIIFVVSALSNIVGAILNWIYRLFSDSGKECSDTVLKIRGDFLRNIGIVYLVLLILGFTWALFFFIHKFKQWRERNIKAVGW